MDFQWSITSRTGEQYSGEDNFPTQEMKDSANLFDLFLSCPGIILAPYGQTIEGTHISLVIPDDMILVFKRRCRFDVALSTRGNAMGTPSYQYIISFEKR